MSRLLNDSSVSGRYLERVERISRRSIRRTVAVATLVGSALIRFMGCLFAAEIRLGNWLVAPDDLLPTGHHLTEPSSLLASVSFRLQEPECPDFGYRRSHNARHGRSRGGFSRCVLFPRCNKNGHSVICRRASSKIWNGRFPRGN